MIALLVWFGIALLVIGAWILACEFAGWRRAKAVDEKYRWIDVPAVSVGPQTGVIAMTTRTDTNLIPIVQASYRV